MRTAVAVSVMVFAGLATSQERRMIRYEVDGTAGYANVSWNNGKGGTEQKQVKLPFEEESSGPVGMLAYVSAQKAKVTRVEGLATEIVADGVHGTVTVKVRVNYRVVGEAESDSPFGIAKASSKVE
jgi:hypothetical protein